MQVHQHLSQAAPVKFSGALNAAIKSDATLSAQALSTPEDFSAISHLRRYAATASEYALDPGLAALESSKDGLGVVWAIYLDEEVIATLRGIPTGHGVTLTERLWLDTALGEHILGPGSWEVGRLVMAPEHRRGDLLPRCLSVVLREFMANFDVRHLHATCLTSTARLYSRFGYRTCASTVSPSGEHVALIHGRVADVASALALRPSHAEIKQIKHIPTYM